MKKTILTIITILVLLFSTSCAKTNEQYDIMTSCYPIYDFTVRITGDKLTVKNLVKAGTEPHDYEMSTSDVINLTESKLFIVNGLGLESYTSELTTDIKNKTFTCTSNVTTIEGGHNHEETTHDHDHDTDPHVWLNPLNAIIMMENIKNKIIEIDPINDAYYEDNFNTNKALFLELDQKYKTTLVNLTSTYLVTSHEAFGYLCEAYGLTQIAISGLSPDDEPTASSITSLINQIKDLNVTTIFYEELVSDEIARSIASQTGLKCDVLDPIEGLASDDVTSNYITIMEKNLVSIKNALA